MRTFVNKPKTVRRLDIVKSAISADTQPSHPASTYPRPLLDNTVAGSPRQDFGNDFSRVPLQRSARAAADRPHDRAADFGAIAAHGVTGAAEPLPYLDRIQSSFGCHDVTRVRAHLGRAATEASRQMGAQAYAFGDRVAFAAQPSLHTAAHEAAHIVQQRSGVHLKNNIGEPGDAYEKHADAVADLVVAGGQAESMLDHSVGGTGGRNAQSVAADDAQTRSPALQMRSIAKPEKPLQIPGLKEAIEKWAAVDKIKAPLVRALAKAYINRPGHLANVDRVVLDTPYGGNKVVPIIHEPSEEQVFDALYMAMDLKKTGKVGNAADWSLKWMGETAQPKTHDDKRDEVATFLGEQAVSKTFKSTALDIGMVGAKSLVTGELSMVAAIEAISEPVAKWILYKGLNVSARVVVKAIPVIGWIWMAYDIADLLVSLNQPAEKALSPRQRERGYIVDAVKAFLEQKEAAARLDATLKKPFDPGLEPLAKDHTSVAPRR